MDNKNKSTYADFLLKKLQDVQNNNDDSKTKRMNHLLESGAMQYTPISNLGVIDPIREYNDLASSVPIDRRLESNARLSSGMTLEDRKFYKLQQLVNKK